jgi:DNA-nicking Smr family endonuclease
MKKSEKHPLALPLPEVFHEAMMDVTPLTPHGRFISTRPQPAPLPLHRPMDVRQHLATMSDPVDWGEDETEADSTYIKPGISRQTLRRLRRGDWHAQAELDLHGLTKLEAKLELVGFLDECRRRGARCIRIIHGKGLRSANREPVLKQHVRHWLTQRDEVLAFVQSRPRDGGSGAVTVLLRASFR